MRAGFGGGCGRAASRRRREREEKVTTWDSNGSWSRWSPWPRLSPPLLRQDGTLSCGSPPPHARAVALHGRRHVDAALALGCDSVTTCTRDMAAARLRTASRAAYT